jgi:two-component system response regulator FixJ
MNDAMAELQVFLIDEDVSGQAMLKLLDRYGYNIERFESPKSFLNAYALQPGCLVANAKISGGVEFVHQMALRRIDLPIVMIAPEADVPKAVAAVKAGAEDYITMPIDEVVLVAAINRAISRSFLLQTQRLSRHELSGRFSQLTKREIDVFDLVVKGLTSRAIAEKLKLSARTVESYRIRVMEKMQAASLSELVRQGICLGRVSLASEV